MSYKRSTSIYCDGEGCDKRLRNLDEQPEEGRKIVIGCDGQNPPSVFFNYCPACNVPPIAKLARSHPGILIQEVSVNIGGHWSIKWSGNIVYYPSHETRGDDGEARTTPEYFTDGGEKSIPEEAVEYGGLVM